MRIGHLEEDDEAIIGEDGDLFGDPDAVDGEDDETGVVPDEDRDDV